MQMPFSRPRAAAVCAILAFSLFVAATRAVPPQEPAPSEPGHLVLVVEGTVKQLRVTHAVKKADAWAGLPQGLTSEFALVMLDAAGKEVQRLPLDLSKFETDESKVDAPVVVEGCIVRSPKIGTLLNIPFRADVATYRFVRGDRALGEVDAASMQRMTSEARR